MKLFSRNNDNIDGTRDDTRTGTKHDNTIVEGFFPEVLFVFKTGFFGFSILFSTPDTESGIRTLKIGLWTKFTSSNSPFNIADNILLVIGKSIRSPTP